jgi:hypothetical protein
VWDRTLLTPVERYYFGAYWRCSWLENGPTRLTKVRWLYKTAPRKKNELALDSDVLSAPSDEYEIPVQLSPAARNAGWTGLVESDEERYPADGLRRFLQASFYDGESFGWMLLSPLLITFTMLLFLLFARSAIRSMLRYWERRNERMVWEPYSPNLYERCLQTIGDIRFHFPRVAKKNSPKTIKIEPKTIEQPTVTPTSHTPKPSSQLSLPFSGVPDQNGREKFVWDESKGIE